MQYVTPMGRVKHYNRNKTLYNDSKKQFHQNIVFLFAPLHHNKVLATVKGKRVKILVDSGAAISCVTISMLKSIHCNLQDMTPSFDIQRISGVGGESHSVLGKIVLPIDFDLKLYHELYVFEHLFTPWILGKDILVTHKARLKLISLPDPLYCVMVLLRFHCFFPAHVFLSRLLVKPPFLPNPNVCCLLKF